MKTENLDNEERITYSISMRVMIEYLVKDYENYHWGLLENNLFFGYPTNDIPASIFILDQSGYMPEIDRSCVSKETRKLLKKDSILIKLPIMNIPNMCNEVDLYDDLNKAQKVNLAVFLKKTVVLTEYLMHNKLPEYDLDETTRLIIEIVATPGNSYVH